MVSNFPFTKSCDGFNRYQSLLLFIVAIKESFFVNSLLFLGFSAFGLKLGLKSAATPQFLNQVFFLRIEEGKADFYIPVISRHSHYCEMSVKEHHSGI